jgi:hypothetical protein
MNLSLTVAKYILLDYVSFSKPILYVIAGSGETRRQGSSHLKKPITRFMLECDLRQITSEIHTNTRCPLATAAEELSTGRGLPLSNT